MNAPGRKSFSTARKDHEGIILDLLDDIVRAESNAKSLVDRLDSISKKPSFRMVDIDMYVWNVAAVAIVACVIGMAAGYLLHGLLRS